LSNNFVIIINNGQIYSNWLLNLFVDCSLFQNQTCLFLCHCSLTISVSTWSWLVASALAFFALECFWLCLSYFSLLLLALQLLLWEGEMWMWMWMQTFLLFLFYFFFLLRSFWQLSTASGIHIQAGVIESFFLVMSFDSKKFGLVQPCGAILHLPMCPSCN